MQWEALKADKSVARDEGGPPGSRLRLAIPSWIVGKDVLQEKESHYFNHDISQTSFSMNLVNHAHAVIAMICSLELDVQASFIRKVNAHTASY